LSPGRIIATAINHGSPGSRANRRVSAARARTRRAAASAAVRGNGVVSKNGLIGTRRLGSRINGRRPAGSTALKYKTASARAMAATVAAWPSRQGPSARLPATEASATR
jgi:hypothetical protein